VSTAGPSGTGVWTQLWRGVVAYRVAALAYACVLTVGVREDFAHPRAALAVLGAAAVWTVLVTAANSRDAGRVWPVVIADHVVCAGLTLLTIPVQGADRIADGAPTLTTAWAAAPVLGSALLGGPWGGLAGALVQGAVSVVVRGGLPVSTLGNAVLLLLAGGVGGYIARLSVAAEARLAEAVRLAAATRERERLARDIHDGVLQVLALVRRRGAELGPAELARLAAEQETALRTLITTGPPPGAGPSRGDQLLAAGARSGPGRSSGGDRRWPAGVGRSSSGDRRWPVGLGRSSGGDRRWPAGVGRSSGDRPWSAGGRSRRAQEEGPEVDLRSSLAARRSETVTVSGPAEAVPLPAAVAGELAAAVGAALDNVAAHADGARAWVLVEDLGDAVVVSVRDDGPGIAPGRLEEAAAAGRLGVARSMRGRLADLGGTVEITSAPGQGTEVEFRVPRT
jgi:signal transduction histidine kinase